MNEKIKKRVLISSEQQDALIGYFFKDLGFELISEDDGSKDFSFVIDQSTFKRGNIPKLITNKEEWNIGKEVNQSYFNKDFLKFENVSGLLSDYFSFGQEFDLVDKFSQKYKNIYTIKIHDSLNLGHLIDAIVVEAYKNQFDHDLIRESLNSLLRQSLKIIESDGDNSQIDLSFSYSEIGFTVSFSFGVTPSWFKRSIDTLKAVSEKSNFHEMNYSKKRERLVISSLWFKKQELKDFKACFFTENDGIKNASKTQSNLVNILDNEVEFVGYQAKNIGDDQSKRIHLARKFCYFIKKVRATQEEPVELNLLTVDDIDSYLEKYPKKEALFVVDLELKKFILKMLQDENIFEGVTEFVTRISQSNLNPFIEEIQRVLGEKSLEDISEIFKVKGLKDLEGEDILIKGVTEVQTEEEWKVKRGTIVQRLKEEVTILKGLGKNIIESDIVKVVADELNASVDEVQIIVESLVEEVIINESIPKENIEEAFMRIFSADKTNIDQSIENDKLIDQISRQKTVIERMSGELDNLRDKIKILKINGKLPTADEIQMAKAIELKKALVKSVEVIRNKDKNLIKMKEDYEKISEAKDLRIKELEQKVTHIQDGYFVSEEHSNKDKVEHLQNENKMLTAKLELALRKINIINGNIDRQDYDAGAKKDKDINILKNEIQMAQSSIERYKQECTDLEYKLIQEKEKFIKLKDEKLSQSKNNPESEEALITGLATEKRVLEEKLRAQNIENKKLEQKLKYTSAQLEESKKKKSSNLMSTVSSKNSDNYVKQIENLNGRMLEVSTDLVERKKEVLRLKQENVTLVANLSELEKKLSTYEKKAS